MHMLRFSDDFEEDFQKKFTALGFQNLKISSGIEKFGTLHEFACHPCARDILELAVASEGFFATFEVSLSIVYTQLQTF